MSTLRNLSTLSNEGHLGIHLADNLHGIRKFDECPRKDAEFIIEITEKPAPGIALISDVITKYFSEKGYRVEPIARRGDKGFEAKVYSGESRDIYYYVLVTASHTEKSSKIRVTTQWH
jgi:hypothetical protein